MSQILTTSIQTKILSQLDTYNYTVPTDGVYTVSVSLDEIPPSGVTIDLQKNTVSAATSATPAATQSNVKLQTAMNCVTNDTISIVLASPSASDTGLNVIRAIANIRPGTV